ncbi:MAG: Gfo/Idh/MocA family oxidoreductase [Paludisphaera borealis]|uniref:Gfo/Idh/MocA family protein n=1 Tax=Paludisphaera borealis TaxID=1387353 RepID=UPI00283AF652|nr:Gfo/Idh/MocA family oxidoreductase [Paludisphaera borealis]MDR3623144.1 Gfo/Idh/MocA family oxidoreductase [Paludisphaera borealis]
MSQLKVGIVGAGYWGPNLIRNFSACPLTEVVAVCDSSPERLETIGRTFSHLTLVNSIDQLLELPIQAVAVATPVSTHYQIASRCLEAGLHVLVEKPLAATTHDARSLVELAEQRQRVLMVDHTYLFNNAVSRIKELVEYGELGDLYYIDSIRINLGLFQRDVNVVWDLAPHDLSIVDYILGCDARSISAWGCAHADRDIEDVAYVNVDYNEQMLANFHVNWLSPVKIRQMIFAGSRKSLIFNELNTAEPIKVYDRGIELGEGIEDRRRLMVGYRTGDVRSPHIEVGEPLQAVVSHFAECIRDGKTPLSDGRLGLRVVSQLEAATRSIRAQGGRIVLSNGALNHGAAGSRANGSGERNQDQLGRPTGEKRVHALLR